MFEKKSAKRPQVISSNYSSALVSIISLSDNSECVEDSVDNFLLPLIKDRTGYMFLLMFVRLSVC